MYELITKQIVKENSDGSITIVSTNSTVHMINVPNIKDTFVLTRSQKMYNYISLGRYSNIKLDKGSIITVKHGNTFARVRTHKSQLNRCDRMKEILNGYLPGDIIKAEWNLQNSTLELS